MGATCADRESPRSGAGDSGRHNDTHKRPVMFFDHPNDIKNDREGEGLKLYRDEGLPGPRRIRPP